MSASAIPAASLPKADAEPGRRRPPVADEAATLAWVSWLRIVAICFVISIHTLGANAVEPDARETLRGTLAIAIDVIGAAAVPVFVMLSGAMLLDPAKYRGPAHFLRKRAGRLVPAVVFWHLWYVAIVQLRAGKDLGASEILRRIVNADLYIALYFFWIVLGLAVVATVLIPFLAQATRRQTILAGASAGAMTSLTMATQGWRGASDAFVNTAWTWWIPYLGFFILGWGLRGVVLRGWRLRLVALGTVALAALLVWQWRNPAAPDWLQTVAPVNYYGISTGLYSCGVFLACQGLLRPDGPLGVLTRGRVARVARTLGDVTLGVFALHLTILLLVLELSFLGSEPASDGALSMLVRLAVVIVGTFAIVVVLRWVPGVRRLL